MNTIYNPIGPMGREYLPTFPLECDHFSQIHVGKYSIHGPYGHEITPTIARHLRL